MNRPHTVQAEEVNRDSALGAVLIEPPPHHSRAALARRASTPVAAPFATPLTAVRRA